MTAKKKKEVKEVKEQITLEDVIVGMVVPDLHDDNVKITDDLLMAMVQYEKETKKSVIRRNKITGSFLFWNMPKKKNKKSKKPKKVKAEVEPEEIEVEEELDEEKLTEELEFDEEDEMEEAVEKNKLDEAMETEIETEVNLMSGAMKDYATEFNIKGGPENVNTSTKKFKKFFEDYKQSE